jgi:hypothetical protein
MDTVLRRITTFWSTANRIYDGGTIRLYCNIYIYIAFGKSLCAYQRCWIRFSWTVVSKNWIKQLNTLPVLHFNRCGTTAHFISNSDIDNQIYVPLPKCTATFRTHCIVWWYIIRATDSTPWIGEVEIELWLNLRYHVGRNSSDGIATRSGLDGAGIESRCGARFSASVQTGPGAHLSSYTVGTGSFPGVKRPGRGVDHPPHLALVLRKG